jgi:elongator complex protein 3
MPDYPTRYRVTPRARGTSPAQQAAWQARYAADPDLSAEQDHLLAYFQAIQSQAEWSPEAYNRIVQRLARQGHPILPKAHLHRGYLALVQAGLLAPDDKLLHRLRLKPTRTLSGVAPVTLLTAPYPCPGQCIFCPTDVRMPKSYLSNEPGAMRALMLSFDPFEQVTQRIRAMQRTGHATGKVEILVLGGTWSSYPDAYTTWFIRRTFDALNSAASAPAARLPLADELALVQNAHLRNESAQHRCVGLTIETRPDHITVDEVHRLRQLGVTRVQLGAQTLDDRVAALNRRGHTAEDTRRAVRLLRSAGFKVAVHVMPNLLGSDPEADVRDYHRWWDDPALRPDEVKLYPTGLLQGTELYEHYLRGDYRPYTEAELVSLLMACKQATPPYVRINRVMRDIPAPDIAAGVTTSNLRQIVQERLKAAGTPCQCIRCREVRREAVDPAAVRCEKLPYDTDHSRELFLSAVTPADRLAGFLRLSLPNSQAPIDEINGHALIRQVQVYGPVVALDDQPGERAQHHGLGSRLIQVAMDEASAAGYRRIAVIAAVGTREYYRRHGFDLGHLYMARDL